MHSHRTSSQLFHLGILAPGNKASLLLSRSCALGLPYCGTTNIGEWYQGSLSLLLWDKTQKTQEH